jgi:magnesium transporter
MHPESAGAHIVTHVPVARPSDRIRAVVTGLGQQAYEALDAVYVVDADRKFLGAVRLPKLHEAEQEAAVAEVMDRDYPRVGSHYDQEHVADLALQRRATSVAVVDEGERFIGAVAALSLLDILRHEHVEDLQRLAGIQREERRIRTALEAPPVRRARHRLPWLLVGLVGSMLAAVVVSRFERVLESKLAVAFFVPAIVYLADAIGTQTEAIVVRGLSLNRLSLGELLAGELRTGLLIGGTLAGLAFPIVAVGFGDARLAVSVAFAILVAGGVATTIGLLLPWMLQRMGSDPAFGSGPVATIIQDVLSLVIYFAIAMALLP